MYIILMMNDYIHLNTLVKSGELGTKSYFIVKRFITVGIRGKKLPARTMPSIFGNEALRGQRWVIKRRDVEVFKKHLQTTK